METNGAIHVSPSSRPSSTTHSRQPSTSYHGHHLGLNSSNHATFIAPPPPPPLGARSNTHSRQTSRVDGNLNYFPVNSHSHEPMNHARTNSASSWIPPPPPPPIGIPNYSGLSPQSAFSPLESALQLSLSPPGPPPSLNYNGTPQISNDIDRETQSTSQANQAHHSRTKSTTFPTHYITPDSSLHQTHTHVVQAINYNSPTSQFITSRPFLNASPFLNSSNNTTHNAGSHPSNHLGNPHHHHGQPSYTYQNSAHFTPGVVSNNMMLTHSPTPFERGPFAASSVPPPQHALLTPRPQIHARSPSFSQSHSPQQSTPPPPRPPKPPELELEYVPKPTTTTTSPPCLPERLQTSITPNIQRAVPIPIIAAPARERIDVGGVESPALSGAIVNPGRHGREDVNASCSNADGGDKLSGSLPAVQIRQVKPTIESTIDLANGDPRHFGDLTRTNTFGTSFAGQPDLAVDSRAKDVPRQEMVSAGNSGSGQGSSNTSADISASGDARTTTVQAGHDGVGGTNEEGQGDIDDMRSDSGMTMDGYDPNAFDFPRRVNDEMASVLSPTTQTFPSSIIHGDNHTNTEPTTTLSPEEESSSSQQQLTMETEAPPTYDEVEMESQLIHSQTPTTLVRPSSHPGTPTFPLPSFMPPTFPPPAFRPETPPSPGGSNTTGTTAHPTPTRAQLQNSQHTNVPGGSHLAPQNSGTRTAAPNRPLPPPLTQDVSTGNRTRSTSDSSSGHGHDGLMMTSRGDVPGPSTHAARPAIYTSPPTPSPGHSPSNSVTRSPTYLKSLRVSLPPKFTTPGEDDSLGSRSPTSDTSDPFQDPPSFQADNSPFALNRNGVNDSPRSTPTEIRSQSPMSENIPQVDGNLGRTTTEKGRSRSYSGFWSNVSSTPSTPKSDLASHELGRRNPEESSNGPQAVISAENAKAKRRTTLGSSGSRLSLFFKSSPVNGGGMSNGNGNASGSSARNSQVPHVPRPRAGGVDLLDDGTLEPTWQEAWGRMPSPSAGISDPTPSFGDGGSPGDEGEQSVLMDLWEGIEFGFGAPGWNTPPAPGPYSNPAEWPEGITLYPVGSKPFFVRAPTWRSLLRFLASQSTLRIEPSVEALATSATPTIDLRLVVQFARTPYTPRGTTRDVCLYMMLHTKMPSLSTRSGRALRAEDRAALESWDTRALPYSFVCAKGGLLARHGVTAAKPNVAAGASELTGTPIADQDPDGEDSMFITIPPPFIELPVKMSDIAMYLHECLVLSRKNGKQAERPKTGQTNGGLAPNHGHKLRKGHGSTPHLPADGVDSKASHTTASGVHVSTPLSTNTDGDVAPSSQQESLSNAPGLKRLAKAIKTFYPEEYAIGSSRANQAAEQAAVEDDHYKGKMMGVKKGKGTSSGKGGGLLGAFQRVRSKSSAAKQTVSGLSTGVAGARGPGRDTNAERFELVTPWRGE